MTKSRDAFRTISEVAEWMETPAHVLRFWESKFSQVKPVKRAGGRRYYRPADMELLGGIKKLLHDEGMTIKGVQKVLRDQGIAHVASLSVPVEDADIIADAPFVDAPEPADTVVPFQAPKADVPLATDTPQPAPVEAEIPEPSPADLANTEAQVPDTSTETPGADHTKEPVSPTTEHRSDTQPELELEPFTADTAETLAQDNTAADDSLVGDTPSNPDPTQSFPQDPSDSPMPSFLRQPLAPAPEALATETTGTDAFQAPPTLENTAPPAAAPPAIPADPDLSAIQVSPGALTALSGLSRLTTEDAEALRPVVERLRAVQDKLSTQRRG